MDSPMILWDGNYIEVESISSHLRSYCPKLLVEHLSDRGRASMGVSCQSGYGACVVLDICGFTKLTKELSIQGAEGLLELHSLVSAFLRECTDIVHEFGGDVICYAGDALMSVFTTDGLSVGPDEAAALRAVCCALRLRSVALGGLASHIGVSTGSFSLTTLGGHHDKWVQVLSGPSVHEVTLCVQRARQREVVLSRAVIESLPACDGGRCIFSWEKLSGLGQNEEQYLLRGVDEAPCLRLLVSALAPKEKDPPDLPPDHSYSPTPALSSNSRYHRGVSLLSALKKFLPAGVVYAIATSPGQPQQSPDGSQPPPRFHDSSTEQRCLSRRGSDDASTVSLGSCASSSCVSGGPADSASELDDFSNCGTGAPCAQASPSLVAGLTVLVPDMPCVAVEGDCSDEDEWSGMASPGLQLAGGVQPVAVLFMKLHDYYTAPSDGAESANSTADGGLLHLQPIFLCIQKALFRTNGFLRQFIVDDKGCVLVAVWSPQVGAAEVRPPQTPTGDSSPEAFFPAETPADRAQVDTCCLEALSCAFEISRSVAGLQYACTISVTSGLAYCGPIGSPSRQEYAALGHTVNRCARMMCCSRPADSSILTDHSTCAAVVRVVNGEGCPGQSVLSTPTWGYLPTALCDLNGVLGCGPGYLRINECQFTGQKVENVFEVRFDCGEETAVS